MTGYYLIYLGLILFSVTSNNLAENIEEEFNGEEIPVVEGYHVQEDEDVYVLTEKNFDDVIKAHKIILVEFYAPWCGHCKSLAPEYAAAAKELKKHDPPIRLAKIDATIQEELAKRFQVQGFPTIFLFKNGEKKEYDGPRSSLGIVEYMKREADPNYKPPPSAVVVLSQDNFTDWVDKQALALVEFYAPWCGHCKRLEPEYERAAMELQSVSPNIALAKVDATENKELVEKYEVNGYPTLFIFRHGSHLRYAGPREEKGIVAYMKEQAKPPSKLIESVAKFDKIISGKENKVVVVAGFFENEEDKFYREFETAANSLRGEFLFYHVLGEKLLKKIKKDSGSVTIYQPQFLRSQYEKEQQFVFEEDLVYHDLVNFLELHRLPLVGQRTNNNAALYDKRYPLLVVYYDVDFGFENRVQTQLIRDQVLRVASSFTSVGDPSRAVTFAIAKEDDFAQELINLGLDDSGEDVNVGFFASPSIRYAMPPTDEFSAEVLHSFIKRVLKGEIKPKIKSQPLPKKGQNSGPLVKVVGANFEEIVLKGKVGSGKGPRNVLIEFYAPWCGHCKKLEPKYTKLAKELSQSHSDSVIVANMDATNNDIPSELFKVEGYPTIYYVSHKDSTEKSPKPKVVKYEGQGREVEDMKKFVLEQLGQSDKDEL